MNVTKKTVCTGLAVAGLAAALGLGAATGAAQKDVSQKSSEASVTTNDNGTVSRTFTELTVATNGTMVTERRRETRTTLDAEGNMLESATSEYAQSYTAGDTGMVPLRSLAGEGGRAEAPAAAAESFLGLGFGAKFAGTNYVADADEPTLLRATFAPKKPLAGFDDYYVYVTPKTHRVAKVCACAKEAIDPGTGWRRHYLIEALEKKYRTWARPQSAFRPIYSFDIGGGRYITTCLAGTSRDYETVIVAWDDALLTTAADETEAIRAEARKTAAERRRARVSDAADAF